MRKTIAIFLVSIILIFSHSCISYREIYDGPSRERQQQIQGSRSVNVLTDGVITIGSVIVVAITGIYVGYVPEVQDFRRLVLENPMPDTMFVNMVTDFSRNKKDFCDFMDIRIPPLGKCRLLVPLRVNYNIYFGITDNPENDEQVGINTSNTRKLTLKPGMTKKDIPDDK